MNATLKCLLPLILAGGCSSAPVAPDATAVQSAMAVAWVAALGMEAAAAPTVEWYDDTTCQPVQWMGNTVAVPGACQTSIIDEEGHARVGWSRGVRVSDTDFVVVLVKWKSWLMTRTWRSSSTDEAEARGTLRVAGL